MTREELIALGYQILAAADENTEAALIAQFNQNVPHPSGFSLHYYPENYNARRMTLADYAPAIEETVDKCLAYCPLTPAP